MVIKCAGQEYRVTNTKRKSRSLGSLTDLTVENQTHQIPSSDKIPNNNNVTCDVTSCDLTNCDVIKQDGVNETNFDRVNKNYCLSKSKSESNPFGHRKKGKIIRLSERPKAQGNSMCLYGCYGNCCVINSGWQA